MAFPTTGVLDSFNAGASQNLTARSGWGGTVLFTADAASLATDTVPTFATSTLGASNFWNTQFQDAEVYCKYNGSTFAGAGLNVYARITATGSVTAYGLTINTTSGVWQLQRYAASVATSIGSSATQAISVGDSFGLECIGSAIKGYYQAGAGAWTQIVSVTDSTITTTGNIGLGDSPGQGHKFDSFNGGAAIAGAPPDVTPYRPMIVQQAR